MRVRHVLFAVTPGVDVRRLRDRAEAALLEVRCHATARPTVSPRWRRELSNCPSAEQGGDLGWLRREDCAPEFAREIFAGHEIGVLPRLVHSRFGLHVVEVLAREAGQAPNFEAVRGAVALALRQQNFVSCAAPVPAAAGRRSGHRRREPRQRRYAAGAVTANAR